MKRKRALVTITPYNEQEKRVLNETPTATATAATTTSAPPAPPPLPLPSKNRGSDDAVEMQSIESFKLKETPSTVPKPPPTYFPVTSPSTGSPRHIGAGKIAGGKDAATSPVAELAKTPSSASPTNSAQPSRQSGGKVAIKIGTYEGETKQPSRLEFLPQQLGRERNSVAEETTNGPVVSRLQNELVATLQRSNLRRKTEGENQSPVKTIPENSATQSSNDTTNSEPHKLLQGNVEKLALALNNKVTIKVNPENNNR